ncbi:MAG: hypothetical protein DI627_14240 [Acinetobacter sp.]|uniref:hypothetical protein n=1 Tax=unclassified Acinetobacter TaxID=196816 RepID=UPI000DB6B6A6|nr:MULTISPECIES: hypothetical protein [unclassified Acinetobacter]PZT84886.1 MAG: hypothetical protein DI627_14240 [Acinetobacter sp.]
MNLSVTPESIVPEQSVIDSWPKLHRKKGGHACQGKCPNYTDEQCCHCLIQDTPAALSDEDKHLNNAVDAVGYVP